MRIGIDCRIYSEKFTGIGRYTKELVNQLIEMNRERGFPHELVLFFNHAEYREFEESKNVKKVLVNAKHYSWAEQTKFSKILKKEKLDHVHFPHFNLPILYRRPFTVTIHDLTITLFPLKKKEITAKIKKVFQRIAYKMIIKNAVKKAKKVIAVSKNTKNDIVEMLNVAEDKIEVVYNGLSPYYKQLQDPQDSHKTLKKYNITKQFFLYTGVWRHHKNLPRLIKAFALLKRQGLDAQLVLTGNQKSRYPEITEAIKEENLEDSVILPGFVSEEELLHLYNAALFYVFPSLYEGFGLPPLESMACGTPVLASNISSIPEICGENNAVLFDPYDTDDIAEKIHALYKDAPKQADLVERGIERASNFRWKKMAKETFDVIKSTLTK